MSLFTSNFDVIRVDGFHLFLRYDTGRLVSQVVQHLRERLGGRQFNDLVFTVFRACLILVVNEGSDLGIQASFQRILNAFAATGYFGVLQRAQIGYSFNRVDMLVKRVGTMIRYRIFVFGSVHGEDDIVGAYALAGIFSLLFVILAKLMSSLRMK